MCQCYILTEEKVVGYWCWNGNKPQKNKISVDRSVQGVKKASTNRTKHLIELRPHEIRPFHFFLYTAKHETDIAVHFNNR